MALYSQAMCIETRQTIWVGTNVVRGKSQSNSHNKPWDHDGVPTAELAALHTSYHGNILGKV